MMRAVVLSCLCSLLITAGCEIPAQIHWSPDRTRAVYLPTVGGDEQPLARLIDDQGKVIAELGQSSGGFAWSSDSKKLYFCHMAKRPEGAAPFEVLNQWHNQAEKPAESPEQKQDEVAMLSVWDQGSVTPLFWMEDAAGAWLTALSPDGQWLAVLAPLREEVAGTSKDVVNRLYVFAVASQHLYPMSTPCRAMGFTREHRLALIEGDGDVGALVEVMLNESQPQLERIRRAAVLQKVTGSLLKGIGDDLLFTTVPFQFPATMPVDASDVPTYALFRYKPEDGSIEKLADATGELFILSPDSNRILLERREGDSSRVAVLDLASGKLHELCNLKQRFSADGVEYAGVPMYPQWRGNGQIAFVALPDEEHRPVLHEGRVYFDVMLYDLTADYKLKPVRTLSESWPTEMKPSFRAGR